MGWQVVSGPSKFVTNTLIFSTQPIISLDFQIIRIIKQVETLILTKCIAAACRSIPLLVLRLPPLGQLPSFLSQTFFLGLGRFYG